MSLTDPISIKLIWLSKNQIQRETYLNQVDLVLSTKGLHQLDIHWLVTVGCKHTEMGLAPEMQTEQQTLKFTSKSTTVL